jgi:hypothetical protein
MLFESGIHRINAHKQSAQLALRDHIIEVLFKYGLELLHGHFLFSSVGIQVVWLDRNFISSHRVSPFFGLSIMFSATSSSGRVIIMFN